MNAAELLNRGQDLIEAGRYCSGLQALEQALKLDPHFASVVHYNIGVTHQMMLGNGETARSHYSQAIEKQDAGKGHLPPPLLAQIQANSCENMLLSSLSFEEYEDWVARLEKLQPGNDAVHSQRPWVRELRQKGLSWAEVMVGMALGYSSGDPAHDAGLHGNAAAIYDLILKHRRELRVSRDDYRLALIRFTALKTIIFSDLGQKMESAYGKAEPQEFRLTLDDLPALLDEYLQANPSDKQVGDLRQKVQMALAIGTPEQTLPNTKGAEPLREFSGTLDWQTSSSLRRAVEELSLDGLRFQLETVQVDPQTSFLILAFRSLQPVASEKWEDAGLALRAIVALTLPLIAGNTPAIRVLQQSMEYSIAIGAGVPVMGLMLTDGTDAIGPLQAGSFLADNLWFVAVKPIFVRTDSQQTQIAAQSRIFEQLIPSISSLRSRALTF